MTVIKEEPKKKKLKYPRSVFLIVSNEFCERFSYYGMRTILALYLKNKLDYSDNTSTVIYHTFTMFVYFFPLFGAMIADSLLGKFKTILYLSIVYAAGQLLLSASAVPTFGLPIREFSMIGLILIAIGTGGIKPCVAAFGGDQFVLPQQEKYLAMYFSIFYFAINSGSLISTFLTPELRNGVKCYGETTCYSVAFLVPAILMILSIVIFVAGKSIYKMKKPEGNVVLNVTKCISHAIYNKTTIKDTSRDHWLDYADDKYSSKQIEDIKSTLQVLKLFIPLPIFWALFDQQGSRWTFQATRMNGEIGNFLLKADQMQVVNPLFIVIFIPIFETCIYPLMAKIHFINTPLKKMTVGGFLAGISFIISALIELKLETTYPVLPSNGLAQLRIFNPTNCSVSVQLDNELFIIDSFSKWQDEYIPVSFNKTLSYSAEFTQCSIKGTAKGSIALYEKQASSLVLTPSSSHSYIDQVDKTVSGDPAVRLLVYNTLNRKVSVQLFEKTEAVANYTSNSTSLEVSSFYELNHGDFDVKVDGAKVDTISIKLGGVYTLETYVSDELVKTNLIVVTPANSMHILWLIPQYIVITMAEVMFSVTGLEFAFTQAPTTMKSLLQAGWLLTVAFGNLIVVIIAEAKLFDRQVYEFFLFAGLMIIDMFVFAIMAKLYKYVEFKDSDSENDDSDNYDDVNVNVNGMRMKENSRRVSQSTVKENDEN